MGATHFLTKGVDRVKAEMSLHVLAYDFRRLMTLLGMQGMLAAIRAYAHSLTLPGVFKPFSLLVVLKDYAAWNASLYSRVSPCPYNSARSSSF
ncbi:MAG: family transposase [Massilia sp.]|nr:family transposase [Massilia sp.]